MIDAKVIAHSSSPNGEELITMEVQFHRFILAEINTHRVLSRNYQSSRAVPVNKMIDQVRTNPAIPVHWGKNQKGMVAEEESNTDVEYFEGVGKSKSITAKEAWTTAAGAAAFWAESLHNAGYHKQIVNRILEPYVWTKGVITATKKGWESVFKLRCHKDAQPEFKALADLIRDRIDESKPTLLQPKEWHMPYYKNGVWTKGDETSLFDAVRISSSCTAQVSYRVLDDSLDKAIKIYDMLNLPEDGVFKDDPPHFSPTEHQAMATDIKDTLKLLYEDDCYFGGNFQTKSFHQYRKMLEQGVTLKEGNNYGS